MEHRDEGRRLRRAPPFHRARGAHPRRELTIKGSFAEISSFPAAIAALQAGRARTDGLITHRFALGDDGRALEALRSDRTAHKVVVVP